MRPFPEIHKAEVVQCIIKTLDEAAAVLPTKYV